MARRMTHRERLLAAISHEQPDMVPIDLGGTVDSSIVVEGYEKIKDHFGIEAENVLCHRMMRVVQVDERILRALDIDTRGVYGFSSIFNPVWGEMYDAHWRLPRKLPGA